MLGNSVALPVSLLPNLCGNVVSIDCQLTVTNIVFKSGTSGSLSYVEIQKDDLKNTLQEIHSHLNSSTTTKVFVTGPSKISAKIIAESVFHTQACIVGDVLATSKGFGLISTHVDLSDVEYKYEGTETLQEKYGKIGNSSMIGQIRKAMQVETDESTETDETKFHFPAILIVASSLLDFYVVKKDRSIIPIQTFCLGTETLKGLAKCITDLNIYEDIVTMAINGNRENVDNQVYELFSEDEKSPYGRLPPNLPLFPFGKCNYLDKGAESFNKDDLLGSLCNMVYSSVTSNGFRLCKAYKITTVYVFGGLFNAAIFAKLVSSQSSLIQTNTKIKIIKTGYILALGAIN